MEERKHVDIGRLIANLARIRGIKGPYLLAQYVRKQNSGDGPTGAAMSAIYRGINRPSPELVRLIDRALILNKGEKAELGRVYLFGGRYDGQER